MTWSIRRLGSDDKATLDLLAREDADFDVDGRGEPLAPLSDEAARAYLADPNVLHWIAEEAGVVIGFLSCYLLHKRTGTAEVLLYEIGVRSAARRRGVGRALIDTLHAFMRSRQIPEVWVLADNDGAVDFYRACKYDVSDDMAVYMTREDD